MIEELQKQIAKEVSVLMGAELTMRTYANTEVFSTDQIPGFIFKGRAIDIWIDKEDGCLIVRIRGGGTGKSWATDFDMEDPTFGATKIVEHIKEIIGKYDKI